MSYWLGFFFSLIGSGSGGTSAEWETFVTETEADFDLASKHYLAQNRNQANEVLAAIETKLQAYANSEKTVDRAQLARIFAQLETRRESYNNITRIVDPRTIADLGKRKLGMSVVGGFGTDGSLLSFDGKNDLEDTPCR